MLLSGQPQLQNETRRIEVQEKPPELSIETRRFPIGGQGADRPSQVPQTIAEPEPDSPPALAGAASGPESEPSPAQAEPKKSPGPNAAGETASVSPGSAAQLPGPAPGRYLVQVASFSNAGNANQLAEVLSQGQLPVLLDNVLTGAGRLHRVRVGPFDQLDEANASLEHIRSLMSDLNPRVVDLRPDENSPVTDPSDPLVRWVVQAGSFADEVNARDLVARLRLNGFAAFSETVRNSSGAVFKVKIGPFIERQGAVDSAAELNQRLDINGLVMSVD